MSKILLSATNISHYFDYQLFDSISLNLKSSSSIAILGRSGCGKSTFLHILSTFLKPISGSVTLLDQDLYTLSEAQIERIRRYDIGIVFQFHYLFKGMSALENIEVATMLSGEDIDRSLLRRLEIEELIDKKISELSGGQQQRVSLARVLSKRPKIVFADEPTGNLDKETAMLVMDVLLEYTKTNNSALLLVTHDEEMASRCDEQYHLKDRVLKPH